ncbi:hypothetical protein AVEN_36738-1 [Araneus ventricosus]|uniref:HAT C-terminal dimerisation domain-containing protein n=1 Tax=Araneus ventricosus TaxID=182803 RepID=A0A4Y2MTC6_ARAVE|nr:hypothetical protein AVEN_36738-1 [Araneus ventricosus]
MPIQQGKGRRLVPDIHKGVEIIKGRELRIRKQEREWWVLGRYLFGKTEQFAWVNLTKTNAVDWENAETSAEIINSNLLDVPDMKINNDELFDEVVLAKDYLQSNWEQWKQEETTRDVIISSEEKRLRLFGHFQENHIASPNLIKIFEYAFCLPGTSAPVERVFSLMNNA